MTTTLLARAHALLQSRAAKAAALAIVPLALAAPAARAQVTITGIEAGFIDVSGGRFVFGSATNNAGQFASLGLFSLDSTTSVSGFSLTGDVHFNGQQNTDGSGEDLAFAPYQRYLSITGTWDSNQVGTQPLIVSLSGSATFAGTLDFIAMNYYDQATGNNSFGAGPSASGQSYLYSFDSSWPTLTGLRHNFTLDVVYFWTPSPADETALLDNTITLNAALSPIPEPSTYAAILGTTALAGVIAVRRSRRVVA